MRSVEAVVTWKASDDSFVTSSSTLVEYNPILPGQVSPFSVLTRYNPSMATCWIEFKQLLGGTIPAVGPNGERL